MPDHPRRGFAIPRPGPDRRQALQAGVAAAAAAGLRPDWLPRVGVSHRAGRRPGADVLVLIFLRGGADGLSMVPPVGDPYYAPLRPQLAVPPPGGGPGAALPLSGIFGLHPALAPLLPAWNAGRLLAVHATGSPHPTRSHFEKERIVETGDGAGLLPTGFLARHLASVNATLPGALLRAIGARTSLPWSLQGAPDSLPVPDLSNFGMLGPAGTAQERRATLASIHLRADPLLRESAADTFATLDLLQGLNLPAYQPAGGAVYPTQGAHAAFGVALRATAALIKAQVGVEAVALDLGDFDTHGQQGTSNGTLAQLLTTLGAGLGALDADLSAGPTPGWTAVVLSEFGRTAFQNGSLGTDHGFGNVLLALGPGIAGGQVMAQWPGLAPAQLYQGRDLAITIDARDILAEIFQVRLQNGALATLFPGFTPTFRGATL